MIDHDHALPITRQAELAGISRGAVYYLPRPVSEADERLMRRIDELHLEHPFAGARMLRDMLNRQSFEIGRKHVATLMARMAIEALYRKPDTSKKHPGHKVYPYLLRGMRIDRANQVWAMDITYIPMARGWVYLAAVVDWASRRVLAHRVSITMDTAFCIEALEEACARHGAARDLQHRPRQPVHQRGVHGRAQGARHRHQHGRQGQLARQRLRGAAVALDQVRGGVPACLRVGQLRQGRHCSLHRVLQRAQTALVAGQDDARRVLLRDAAGNRCGSLSGEHELPTASVVRFVASAERPPPWTTLHRHHIRRVPLIKLNSVFRRVGPALRAARLLIRG